MQRVPFFIEVLHSSQSAPLQICRKTMAGLFRRHIAPLPFAGSMDEVHQVLASLKAKGISPAVLVINTYWADEILPQVDVLIKDVPLLLFVREIITETTTTRISSLGVDADKTSTTIEAISQRPKSIWGYGAKTTEQMADTAAVAIEEFLKDGNFVHIERRGTSMRMDDDRDEVRRTPARQRISTRVDALPCRASSDRILTPAGSPAIQNSSNPEAAPSPPQPATPPRIFIPPPPPAAPPPAPTAGAPLTAVVPASVVPASVPAKRSAAQPGIRGLLTDLSLPCLLTMLELERKTGELTLRRPDEMVMLHVRDGRVVQAALKATPQPPSLSTGVEVVYHALTWLAGEFLFSPQPIDTPDRIQAPMQSLLMEGARRIDTAAAGGLTKNVS
ncbi:MAG TPA: DUF4388 domain-containing protein [Planctomycetota bacterium]|jgi:hypothetical protein